MKISRHFCSLPMMAGLGLAACSLPAHAVDLFAPGLGAGLTLVDTQRNSTTYAAANLLDDNDASIWGSYSRDNDLIFSFGPGLPVRCFNQFSLENYGDSRSLKNFMLLYAQDSALSTDTGFAGWTPIVAESNPVGPVNHLHWAQGGKLTSVDTQRNTTTYAGENINNGNTGDLWGSYQAINEFEFEFDTNWDGSAGDEVNVTHLQLYNYGDTRSVRNFQAEVSTDGVNWEKLEVPGTAAGDADFNFLQSFEGGTLDAFTDQRNSTSYAAANIHDGTRNTIWGSYSNGNELEFSVDTDLDGTTGLAGDSDDLFTLEKIRLENYGDTRSLKRFQVFVKTLTNPDWTALPVPSSAAGEAGFNFLLDAEGGQLDAVSSQRNTTSYAGANLHDGTASTIWGSYSNGSTLDFSFDPDLDGTTGLDGDTDDLFSIDSFVLENYGDTRSVKDFQLLVKTQSNLDWTAIPVPGSTAGQSDFNFLSVFAGAQLTDVDSERNSTTYAGANLHDETRNTIWGSYQANNTLDFVFDIDDNGVSGEAADRFTIDKFELENYGDTRSVNHFQVEVQTATNPAWTKLEVPGTAAGDSGFNFLSKHEGAVLTAFGNQRNSSSYAAANVHDGAYHSIWGSYQPVNSLEFAFDTDLNGSSGDAINLDSIELLNYGDSRSLATFEVDVQIGGGPTWQAVTLTAGGTLFSASAASTLQSWPVVAQANVTALRIRTLSTHGSSEMRVREFRALGDAVGPGHTFQAAQSSSLQTFTLDTVDRPVDVTALRFRTIDTYGSSETRVRELRALGESIGRNTTFVAEQSSAPQTFTPDSADLPTDVTALRFQTISTYGSSEVRVRELQVLGESVTRKRTFEAAKASAPQEFVLDPADVPVDVTAVRLTTLNTHGSSEVRIREFAVLGDSLGPSRTFTAEKAAGEQLFALDEADQRDNIVAARLRTIETHGSSETRVREFGLMGDPVGPSYIFEAAQPRDLQSFAFPAVTGRLFRVRTFDTHGSSEVRMREVGLQSDFSCAALALWHFDEENWGDVTDSSGNNYTGVASNGAKTDDEEPAIEGTPGTCGYGVFNGNNSFVSFPGLPNLADDFTIAAWIRPNVINKDQRIFADDASNTTGYAFSLGDGGAGRLRFFSRGVDPVILDSPAVISADTWHHVAIVHDVAARQRRIYVDGDPTPVAQDTYTGTWGADPGVISVGGEIDGAASSEGTANWRFDGLIDEVVVFERALDGDEIAWVRSLVHNCVAYPDPDQPAFAFNCVQPGNNAVNGRLLTRVTGQPFELDIFALRDDDDDLVADSIEADFAANSDRTVQVELIDNSSAADCGLRPGLSPGISQDLLFTATEAGEHRGVSFQVDRAYRSVGCRMTDATDSDAIIVGCSSDSFAVRPAQFTLEPPALDNDGSGTGAKAKTGETFTLEVTAGPGYDATPVIGADPLGIRPVGGNTGTLSGSFTSADIGTGTASGDFTYSEVGNFQFVDEALRDNSFTAIDQVGDCVADSFSNSPDGQDRVGCGFANDGATDWVGRFIPDRFTIRVEENGELLETCTGFSYAGEVIPFSSDVDKIPEVIIEAVNQNNDITLNYQGDYAKLELGDINVPDVTEDSSNQREGSPSLVALSWDKGSPTLGTSNGVMTLQLLNNSVTYSNLAVDRRAFFDAAVELLITEVEDEDGVKVANTDLPLQIQPAGVQVRHGRLSLQNAYGSELETLPMQMQVEYYDGSGNGYRPNTADTCTSISGAGAVVISDPDTGTGPDAGDSCLWDSANASGSGCTTAGEGFYQYSPTPLGADFNLHLKGTGTGNIGVLDVTASAPGHLQFPWHGTAPANPTATASFGIHNTETGVIFLKEVR